METEADVAVVIILAVFISEGTSIMKDKCIKRCALSEKLIKGIICTYTVRNKREEKMFKGVRRADVLPLKVNMQVPMGFFPEIMQSK